MKRPFGWWVMPNEPLRLAMASAGMGAVDLAAAVGVDPKTVERWLTQGRVPHPRHRSLAARALAQTEDVLWPTLRTALKTGRDREIVEVFPHRSELPRATWRELFEGAGRRIWCVGYTSYFLWTEVPALRDLLGDKLASGVDVRFLLGDPDSPVTAERERIEQAALTVSTRIGISRAELDRLPGVQVRSSDRHIAVSVWVFDDDMVVSTHLADLLGHDSPTLHVRRRAEAGVFDRYLSHVEYLWDQSLR